jgi:hypothetical protein
MYFTIYYLYKDFRFIWSYLSPINLASLIAIAGLTANRRMVVSKIMGVLSGELAMTVCPRRHCILLGVSCLDMKGDGIAV